MRCAVMGGMLLLLQLRNAAGDEAWQKPAACAVCKWVCSVLRLCQEVVAADTSGCALCGNVRVCCDCLAQLTVNHAPAEHRYYGESMPLGSRSLTNEGLVYLVRGQLLRSAVPCRKADSLHAHAAQRPGMCLLGSGCANASALSQPPCWLTLRCRP